MSAGGPAAPVARSAKRPPGTGRNGRGPVEVRAGRSTRRMRATLVEDPERVADVYERLLPAVGVEHARRLGLVLAGDRFPTREELIEGIRGRRAMIALADR